MLEIVFSESAAGSMAMAMALNRQKRSGGAISVFFSQVDGHQPADAEIKKLQQEAEERERCTWAESIPMNGSREDIINLSVALSVGNIDEDGIGLNRESSLRLLMGTYPDIAEETVETSLRNASQGLAALLKRVEDGEPIRIWSSNNPDDACGLHWLMEQLRPLGFDRLHVTLVMFPAFEKQTDGAVLQHIAWGEIEPYRWGRMAKLGKNYLQPRFVHCRTTGVS